MARESKNKDLEISASTALDPVLFMVSTALLSFILSNIFGDQFFDM